MRAGRARHKIVIESFSVSNDSYGQPIKTWSTYATRWAEVRTLKGREMFEASQTLAQAPVEFRIRYDTTADAITEKMRVVWDGQNHDIDSIQNVDGKNRDILIYAHAGVTQG